jgi:isocitrate/isopropylmalate dehydrogenase
MGFAPSANIGTGYAMFEPAHGSAPDIAGKGVANPIAAILSAGMMLDWLGAAEQAKNIQRAVSEVVSEGKFRTPDMGGSSSTMEIASAVCNKL